MKFIRGYVGVNNEIAAMIRFMAVQMRIKDRRYTFMSSGIIDFTKESIRLATERL